MIRISIAVYVGAMMLAAVSQVLLKTSAGRKHANRFREYANRHVAGAYALFSVSMAATLYAYRYIPMSLAPILETTGVVFVAILGRIFLGERIGRRKLAGIMLVLGGVVLISLGGF